MTRLLALALLLPLPALAQEAESIHFECADGTRVDVAYPDAETAVMEIDDATAIGLALDPGSDPAAPSYLADGVTWMPDGDAAGTLMAGEGDAAGTACVVATATTE